MNSTQKCPMCAETIPAAATTCEYCGAQFKVTSSGYCQSCHEVREADESGRCQTCGSEVLDWQVESKLAKEFIQRPGEVPAPIAQPQITKPGRSPWLYGVMGGFLVLVVIGAVVWSGRNKLPVISALFATITPTATLTATPSATPTATLTARPTLTPTFAHSPTATRQPTAAATPLPNWVVNFSEPILAAIKNLEPDFQDDFHDKSGGWFLYYCSDWRMQYVAGELVVTNCDVRNDRLKYTDFVLEVEARFVSYNPADGRWGVVWHDNGIIINNWGEISWLLNFDSMSVDSGKAYSGTASNHILLVVKGTGYALYVNDQPLAYIANAPIPSRNIGVFVPRLGQTKWETVVAFDNFKIWDISDLP